MNHRYREFPLGPPLDEFVESVWMLEAPAPLPGTAPERITPDGCVEVIFQFAAPARAAAPGQTLHLQPRAFVIGPLAGPLVLEHLSAAKTLGIRFRPGGAAAFLPFSIDDLSASELGVEDAFGGSGRHIAEELAECCCGRIRLRAVERFLTQALRDAGSGGRSAHSVAAAISRMLAGRRGISSLAREQGWSVRQLERRFLREVGLPPRLLARIFRFQRVLRATAAAPGRDWVSIALECGYADQPHLIREFREFAGETPVSFSRAEPGLARAFISPERLERFFA